MAVTEPGQRRPRAACIYCRLSYAPDGSVEKVERQEADGRALAERLGWPVCCVYVDNSRSAWQRNRKRPDWDRMLVSLNPAADHQHDAIITYHGDRLMRQPWDLELLLRVSEDRHLPLASVAGIRDLSNPDDRFILRIEVAQACKESDNTSRRVQRALKSRAARGLTQAGGRRPFGYGVQVGTRTMVRDGQEVEVPVYDTTQQVPEEAKLGAAAVERLLAGQSKNGVVRWLNERSTTTEGNPWTVKAFTNWLLSPRIAGLIEHDGQLLPAAWAAIIPVETWEDVKALLERNAKAHPYQGRERKYLLTGAAECCKCGGPVKCKPSGGRNRKTSRIYYCGSCKGIGRNVEHLDRYVEARTVRLLNDPRLLAEVHQDDGQPGIAAEIATLERRKGEAQAALEELADHPEVDPLLLARSLASFDRKITELRTRMAATADRRLLVRMLGITQEQWDAEPLDVRSATVRALWRVIIKPATWRGPGFDPASVDLVRRPL